MTATTLQAASPQAVLRFIKMVHTVVWAFFAGAIVAIPISAAMGRFGWAGVLSAFVMVEVLVLALNGLRCPLTGIAARYTPDRRANFDIYLPLWVATWNKQLFGALYVVGAFFAIARWWLR
jgi:hypothetical protein